MANDVGQTDGKEPEEIISKVMEKQSEAAIALLQQPNALYQIKQHIDKTHVGDDEAKMLLFLGLTYSVHNKNGLNFAIKAPSSGGKSHMVSAVVDLMPQAVMRVDGSSEKGLLNAQEAYKPILFLSEYKGVSETTNQILKLGASDGGFKYLTNVKDDKGNVEGATIELKARAYVTTTTRVALDPELETRHLELTVDCTEPQTISILDLTAKQEWNELNRALGKSSFDKQQAVVTFVPANIPEALVIVPFADGIKSLLPTKELRVRRDFGKLLTVIRNSAVFHYLQRPCFDVIGEGYPKTGIIALPQDLCIALILGRNVFASTISGLVGRSGEVYTAVKALDDSKEDITTGAVVQKTKIPAKTVRFALSRLADMGYISEIESLSTKRSKHYKLSEGNGRGGFADALPTQFNPFLEVKQALDACRQRRQGGIGQGWEDAETVCLAQDASFINPLTGEQETVRGYLGLQIQEQQRLPLGGVADAADAPKPPNSTSENHEK